MPGAMFINDEYLGCIRQAKTLTTSLGPDGVILKRSKAPHQHNFVPTSDVEIRHPHARYQTIKDEIICLFLCSLQEPSDFQETIPRWLVLQGFAYRVYSV